MPNGVWKNRSIRTKVLVLLFAVLMISSVLLFQITTVLTQNTVRDFMYQNLIQNQEKAQNRFDFMIGEVNMLAVRLLTKSDIYQTVGSRTLSVEGKHANLDRILESMNINKNTIGYISIVSLDGFRFGYGEAGLPDQQDPLYERRIEESKTPAWGSVRNNREGHAYIPLGRKFQNFYTGQRLGYLIIYIRERALYNVLKNMVFAEWGDSILLSGGDEILSMKDESRAGTILYDPSLFETGSKGYKVSNLRDSPSIVFHYRLGGNLAKMGMDWSLVSIVTQKQFFAKLNAITGYSYMVQAVLVVLVLIVSWYVSQRIVGPVNRLSRNIRKFGEGGGIVVPYVFRQSNDELTLLENSFKDMVVRIEGLIQKINEDKDRQRATELIALQAQINPHFLYNTLDTIGWISKMNKQKEIERMIMALASFYRLSLHQGDKYITVREELGIIESYLILEEMRFPDKFDVSFDIEQEMKDCRMLKIILQPLVENAIKHGVSHKRGKGYLTVKGYVDGEDLRFEVRDDGVGFRVDRMEHIRRENDYKGGGYGIRNVDERIKLEYGAGYGVSLVSEAGIGTVASVKIKAYRSSN
jgi:two-component system sensor histidine kinase YesM